MLLFCCPIDSVRMSCKNWFLFFYSTFPISTTLFPYHIKFNESIQHKRSNKSDVLLEYDVLCNQTGLPFGVVRFHNFQLMLTFFVPPFSGFNVSRKNQLQEKKSIFLLNFPFSLCSFIFISIRFIHYVK